MKPIAFLLVALCATATQAAVIHIKPSLVTVFDSSLNDVTETAINVNDNGHVRLRPGATPYTMNIDFSFTISDLREDQLGFGNAAFNIHLDGELSQSWAAPDWQPESRVDHNGFPGNIWPKWADNGDYGIAGDLRGIVVGIDPGDFLATGIDPRREFGQHGDEYFGNLYVDIPSVAGTFGHLSVEGDGGSVYNANNKLVDAGVTVTGGAIDFQVVPEPSSAVLLGLGGVLLGVYGRHVRRWRSDCNGRRALDKQGGALR